jgi:hypothetical protein
MHMRHLTIDIFTAMALLLLPATSFVVSNMHRLVMHGGVNTYSLDLENIVVWGG